MMKFAICWAICLHLWDSINSFNLSWREWELKAAQSGAGLFPYCSQDTNYNSASPVGRRNDAEQPLCGDGAVGAEILFSCLLVAFPVAFDRGLSSAVMRPVQDSVPKQTAGKFIREKPFKPLANFSLLAPSSSGGKTLNLNAGPLVWFYSPTICLDRLYSYSTASWHLS